jgi:protein-disulfide isomerase
MVETKKSSLVKKAEEKSVSKTKSTNKKVVKKSQAKIVKTEKKVVKKPTTKATTKVGKKVDNKKETKDTKTSKVESKTTHKKRISESNMWKITSAVLVIMVIFLAVVIGIRFFTGSLSDNSFEDDMNKKVDDLNNQKENGVKTNDGNYGLLIIEDSECTNCNVEFFADQIKTNLIPELAIEKIEYSSDVGQTVIDSLGIKIAPIFLFTESTDTREDWEKLESVLIPVEVVGTKYYLLNPMVLESKVLIEEPIQTQTAITLGNKDAKVTLVEFSDFECPVCALMKGSPKLSEEYKAQSPDFVPTIPKIMKEYVDSGKVKYVFYNFPIDRIHKSARAAHNAALCANEQDKFKEYSDELYNQRETWVGSNNTNQVLKDFTTELNLNKEDFNTCLDEQKYNRQIDEEMQLAMPYGVGGTPTYFVNKQIISGLTDYETFKAVIETELEKANN